jgi:hypothetical protein
MACASMTTNLGRPSLPPALAAHERGGKRRKGSMRPRFVMAAARGRGWRSLASRARRGQPEGEAAAPASGAGEGALRSGGAADLGLLVGTVRGRGRGECG